MRAYPHNSPEAAGRILALVLLADGHVCLSEISQLQRLGAEDRLGLSPGALARLLRELSEDLLMGARSGGTLLGAVDADSLRAVMGELTHPILRSEVLTLAQAAAQADQQLAAGEALVLEAARRHWLLPVAPRHAALAC
jgi:hypothetical protein